ncbi:hypothetical protein B0H66DRAFT_51792 [Apodospora peruviana]|uniref:Uncharacterized protein n=1 Tax=Apodospora peruviana TaxID=516989 RepID=A0AAE0IS06_9PEZI|nr:hypothetical protein B0H66DRAFT_51792 [Apodospora peruviana]
MAPSTHSPVSANRGDAPQVSPGAQSAFYKIIMTPIVFVSFLVSLTVVDFRYSVLRSHYHAEAQPVSRMPRWLHRLLYRYRQYQYLAVDEYGRPLGGTDESSGGGGGRHWYYHSKQRKLVKMEAADAFEIRSTVLVFLGLLALCLAWGAWCALSWGLAVMLRLRSS